MCGILLQQPYYANLTNFTILVQMSLLQVPGLGLPWVNTLTLLQNVVGPAFLPGGFGRWRVGLGLRVSEWEESGGPQSPWPSLPGPV